MRQLRGVGDAAAGEWREWSGRAYHLRRRLSTREAAIVGPVLDIRGTAEALQRAQRLGTLLRFVPTEVLTAELGAATGAAPDEGDQPATQPPMTGPSTVENS